MLLISPSLKHLLLTLQKKNPTLRATCKMNFTIIYTNINMTLSQKAKIGEPCLNSDFPDFFFFGYSGSHPLVLLCQKFHDAIWHMHVSSCISWVFEGRWFPMSININWKQKYSNCINWEVTLSKTKPKHSSLGIDQICRFQNSQAVSKIAVKNIHLH